MARRPIVPVPRSSGAGPVPLVHPVAKLASRFPLVYLPVDCSRLNAVSTMPVKEVITYEHPADGSARPIGRRVVDDVFGGDRTLCYVSSPPFARRRLSHFGHHRGIVGYSIFPNLYGERSNLRISLGSDRATASAALLPHHLCRGKLTYRIGRLFAVTGRRQALCRCRSRG